MTTRLSFVDQIKALFHVFRDDKNVALAGKHEMDVRPFPTSAGKRADGSVVDQALEPKNQVGALLVSGKPGQFWSANQKSGEDIVQTPSNLT